MFHTVPYDETRLWAGNDQQQQRPQSVAAAGTASEPRLLNQRTSSIPAAAAAAATAAADEPPTPRTVQRHLFNEWGHAASPRPATVASRSIKSTIIKPAPPTASSMTSVASTSAAAAADTGSPSSTSRTASLLAARNRSGAAARAQSATAVFQSHAGAKHDTGVHDFFTSDSGRWLRKVVAGAIALTVLVVYLSTMYQHVPGGDAGELIIGAHQWAVVHPPGYPLFTTIGFVFDAALSRLALPNGSFCHSTACHVGLVSVVFDTAAAVLIFWLVTCVYFPELQFDIGAAAASSPSDPRRVSAELVSGISRLIGGAIAALLFAFSPLVWTYATQAEVFPINNFFVALLFLVLYLYARDNEDHCTFQRLSSPKLHYAIVGCFISGLSLTNQHTSVFVIAPIAITLLLREGQHILGDRRVLVTLSSAIAAGLSLYLLMPIQHLLVKENSWGDTTSIMGFLTHFLRSEYGTLRLYSGNEQHNVSLLDKIRFYLSSVGADTLWLGLALAVYGAWVCSRPVTSQLVERLCKFFKKTNAKNTTHERQAQAKHQQSMARCSWLLNQALGSSFLIYITLFFWLCNLPLDAKPLFRGVFERFFQQPNVIVFIWLGIGCSVLLTQVLVRFANKQLLLSVAIVAVAIVSLQVVAHYDRMDQHNSFYIEQYGRAILEPLPRNALLLLTGDLISNSVQYLRLCKGYRTDVTVLLLETMTYPWFARYHHLTPRVNFPANRYHPFAPDGFSMLAFLDANYPNYIIFNSGGWRAHDDSFRKKYTTISHGFSDQVVLASETVPHNVVVDSIERAVPQHFPLPSLSKYGPETWEYIVRNDYFEMLHERAYYWLSRAMLYKDVDPKIHKEASDECSQLLSDLIAAHHSPKSHMYLNAHLCIDHQRIYYTGPIRDRMVREMLGYMRKYLAIADKNTTTYSQVFNNLKAWDDFLEQEGKRHGH